MICPRCLSQIAKPGRFCVSCGHDFGQQFPDRVQFYFDLKDEVERFSSVQQELSSGFSQLKLKIQRYEEMLSRDLTASAPTGAPLVQQTAETAPSAEKPRHATAAPAAGEPAGKDITREPVFTSARHMKRASSEFEVNVGQKWLLAIGVLTMVFGVGYFLKYSFDQGWVGPAGRVTMAYVWGVVFLGAGDWFRKKIERFGLSLIGGGIAVLYFSTFAAFQIYHLFGQIPSFGVMILITVLACALAVHYDTKWLAVLGLVGGFLTPVLLTTGQDNQIALMTYLTILNLGLLGIALYKKWDLLNILGFIFTYLLYSAWYAQHYQGSKFLPAIMFLNIFFVIYALVPFTQQVRRKEHSSNNDLYVMAANAFLAFGFNYVMITERSGLAWVSIVAILYAGLFLVLATYLYRNGLQSLDVFVVMAAKAMLFLIITIPLLFSRHWITLCWSAQSFVIVWMGVRLERRSLTAGGYALLLLSVLKFLFHDYPDVFHVRFVDGFMLSQGYLSLMIERYITTALLLAAIFAIAREATATTPLVRRLNGGDGPVFQILFGIVLFLSLTIEVSAFFAEFLPQARFAALSVLWTLYSVVLMLLGFKKNSAAVRKTSFGLFLVVLLKVFLFDMANISTPYRIISFIILGMVLLGTSYLYYRHKDRIITALADDEQGGKER